MVFAGQGFFTGLSPFIVKDTFRQCTIDADSSFNQYLQQQQQQQQGL
jgi:hypothetical protein